MLGALSWRKEQPDPKGLLGGILRVGLQPMVIVTEFGCPVHEYVDHFGQLVFSRPEVCPHCHAVHLFIGHGFYLRKALSATQVYLVRIKRWYCKAVTTPSRCCRVSCCAFATTCSR